MHVLPNTFFVGAPRSGTTTLYTWLAGHPQVYLTPIKEPNFMATDVLSMNFSPLYRKYNATSYEKWLELGKPRMQYALVGTPDWYAQLFAGATKYHKTIGEFSTNYLFSKTAYKNIHALNPQAKIVIVLRDPVERAYSHYLMNLSLGLTAKPFLQEVEESLQRPDYAEKHLGFYIRQSTYHSDVKKYFDTFGRENVFVIIFEEDIVQNPEQTFERLLKFLGIDALYKPERFKGTNASYAPRWPWLHRFLTQSGIKPFLRKILPVSVRRLYSKLFKRSKKPRLSSQVKQNLYKLYFEDDVKKLSKLLDKELPWGKY